MRRNNILLRITIAFILLYAYLPIYLLFDHDLHQPFLFYHVKGGIAWYHYADYLFTRISFLIFMHLIVQLVPKYREYLFTFLLLWIGYVIDYTFTFNQPFAKWHFIPLSYSLFAGSFMVLLTFSQWQKKKH